MSLLTRYILTTFIHVFFLVLGSLVGLFTIGDFVENIDKFVDAGATIELVAIYYYYNIPYFIDTAIPMSMLLGTVFSLGMLNRHYEIAALRASGVSLWRMTRGLIALGLCIVFFQFWFQNLVVMPFNHANKTIMREQLKPRRSPQKIREVVRQDPSGWIILMNVFDTKMNYGYDVALLSIANENLTRRYDIPKLSWIDSTKQWSAVAGTFREFNSEGNISFSQLSEIGLPLLSITPADIAKEQVRPDEMNIFQLTEFIKKKQVLGLNPHRWIVDFHFKIAFVFSGFITLLLGISFAIGGSRENLASAVGKSIVVLFVYYILIIGGQKVGHSSSMHPAISVWFGNVFFLLLGSILFFKTSKE
jgi:lipopolysaccharide export system permease protein